jgi:hypothetical protein
MREKIRARSTTLLAVGLAHAGLFALFFLSTQSRYRQAAPEILTTLFYFDEPHPATATSRKGTPPPRARRRDTHQDQSSLPVTAPVPPDASTSDLLALPRVDWSDEARRASETTLALEEKEHPRRSFDFPKGMAARPGKLRDHVFGDIEHFEGGENIIWFGGRCYYTNRPLSDFAANAGPGPPLAHNTVCKHR